MTRAILAALLLAACSATHEETTAPTVQHRVVLSLEAAESASEALGLWRDATGGEFDPTVVVSDACAAGDWCVSMVDEITDCPGQTGPLRGCTYPTVTGEPKRITLQRSVPEEERVSVFAHEFGHGLGLHHTEQGLMDPHRAPAIRRSPCVAPDDVWAAGMEGPGACL